MDNYNHKNHSILFNKYYCLIENAVDTEIYYIGVSDFLRYRFKKILITTNRDNNSNLLNENDIEFLKKISTIKNFIFLEIKNEEELITLELKSQFNIFLKTLFDGVNRFEREQFPCYNTGLMFRKLNEMIELLDEWGVIPDYWQKIKKYCKFKAVDIFKKLNKGEIPKSGGPKEEISKNDIDNGELYEWAKQENMDLNEINRTIYNQKNGKNSQNKKEQDEKILSEFVEFKNKEQDDINKKNKLNFLSNNILEKPIEKNSLENYDEVIEEFENEISTENKNNNINENKIKKITDIKTNIINDNSKKNIKKEISNKDIISINQKFDKSDSINRAKPITLNSKDIKRIDIGANLRPDDMNKIFGNKQNSIKDKTSKYEFLNDTIESKIKTKRIASISNRIINHDNFNDEEIKQNDILNTDREIKSNFNLIDKNKLSSDKTIETTKDRIAGKQLDSYQNSRKFSNVNVSNNRLRKNNIMDNKTVNVADNSLLYIDNIKEDNVQNKNLEKQKSYEDINAISYDKVFDSKQNFHAFNPQNNLNNFTNSNPASKIQYGIENVTSNKDNAYNSFNINKSVNISNDNRNNFSLNKINDTQQITADKINSNTTNESFNNKLNINPIFREIPCSLGSGYKFSYDKYMNPHNEPTKKIEFIKKIENKEHKKEDEIQRMLNDLKGNKSKKPDESLASKNQNFLNEKKNVINEINKKDNIEKPKFSENIIDPKNENETKLNQNPKIIESPEKQQNFKILETKMLKNFKIKNYKDLPNFELPLIYDSAEKKSRIKKYFIDTAKSSLQDIKKDDISSTIKKLELMLFYFTNMKEN